VTSARWERIKKLFEETVARSAGERVSFIQEACAGDEELRVELWRLVSQYEAAGDFLEDSPLLHHSVSKEGTNLLAPGTRLGPYEILALAGRGGMGEVYRARDTRLDRQVAIKVIGASLYDDPVTERRFDDEARLAARLDHPGICAVYDVGQHEGMRYFVMEFLEGESLATRLKRGPLPTGELFERAIEIASALAYAHRHHIVHRDIKPGNVLLTASGVKVVDFGLARMWQVVARQQTVSTGIATHTAGCRARHTGVHVARTSRRPRSRPSQRCFRVRRGSL
jgi:serine/threonine protein kinase